MPARKRIGWKTPPASESSWSPAMPCFPAVAPTPGIRPSWLRAPSRSCKNPDIARHSSEICMPVVTPFIERHASPPQSLSPLGHANVPEAKPQAHRHHSVLGIVSRCPICSTQVRRHSRASTAECSLARSAVRQPAFQLGESFRLALHSSVISFYELTNGVKLVTQSFLAHGMCM